MANFNWKIISWKRGSATSHAEYIWRLGSFSGKEDLIATGFGNLPAWCHGDPAMFWRFADLYERHNGCACRELVVSLPRELGRSQWIALVENLIAQDMGSKAYQYAIHEPRGQMPGESHPHAHILYSDRIPDGHARPAEVFFRRFNPTSPALGGCKKDSGGLSPKQLQVDVFKRKDIWAKLQNNALAAAGSSARVDHRPARAR